MIIISNTSRETLLNQGHLENLPETNKAWNSEQSKDIKLNRYEAKQVCLRIAKIVMSSRQYQVYTMHINEGKTLKEIAESLGLSYETIRSMKTQANNRIKEVVADTGLAEFLR